MYCVQTEEEAYLRVGPGSPGYTRGGPRSPGGGGGGGGDPFPRSPAAAGSEAGVGPRSATKRRSREEEEVEQQRKKANIAKASIAVKVGDRGLSLKIRGGWEDQCCVAAPFLAARESNIGAGEC